MHPRLAKPFSIPLRLNQVKYLSLSLPSFLSLAMATPVVDALDGATFEELTRAQKIMSNRRKHAIEASKAIMEEKRAKKEEQKLVKQARTEERAPVIQANKETRAKQAENPVGRTRKYADSDDAYEAKKSQDMARYWEKKMGTIPDHPGDGWSPLNRTSQKWEAHLNLYRDRCEEDLLAKRFEKEMAEQMAAEEEEDNLIKYLASKLVTRESIRKLSKVVEENTEIKMGGKIMSQILLRAILRAATSNHENVIDNDSSSSSSSS